jgi:hypothetical protein
MVQRPVSGGHLAGTDGGLTPHTAGIYAGRWHRVLLGQALPKVVIGKNPSTGGAAGRAQDSGVA